MKRIQFHRYGGPEEMRLEEYQLPKRADDEILVRVRASSINPVDWKMRQGATKIVAGRKFPSLDQKRASPGVYYVARLAHYSHRGARCVICL